MWTSRLVPTLATIGCLMLNSPASAGVVAGGCDDLGSISVTPAIDFNTQVQPILTGCASCHGASGPAGLDLRAGEAYGNLVGVTSTTNVDRVRVEPFAPANSALFLAVACDEPGGPGFRMPGTTTGDRALIRDWIAQGARAAPEPIAVPVDSRRGLLTLAFLMLIVAGVRLFRPSAV